ncbi:MAG: flagellar biosynthetic protein FliR [Spirochaetales bacterium]|nr:flagellar biosynthetic protein FliR [Spirochaetales bacterium]MCF7937599.1 flagellar biosynthetic protein FliR [Spirochaetales bacterium]
MEFGVLSGIVVQAQLFFLIFARIFALIQISPLLSSRAIPQVAKIGLSLFVSSTILPWVADMGYIIPESGLIYAMLLLGEVLVGLALGFLLVLIYAAFQVAGQFFSLQMGFGASQVFDPMAQIRLPLMGQFLNLVAMFVFVSIEGFQRIFLVGVYRSFEAVRAIDFVTERQSFFRLIFSGLSTLFEQALVISFPILGTLFLIHVTMGLLAKAAPQMNLLMLGFPIAIMVAFLILFLSMPFIMETFGRIIDGSFFGILEMLDTMRQGSG